MAYKKILFRRDSAASWTSLNPTLSTGEIGLETDTSKLKLGNGSTAWNSLSYFIGNLTAASLDSLGDVTITSAANGDFLRWNGTAWINDAVNLSTDTVGSYVESLVAGTGVTLTNNSGEAATPTVAIGQAVGTSASVTFANVTSPLTGNASTASTLQTARTISLSGDVSGSVSFNGSANVDITATVQPNSVALGTDTTGNYMSDLTQGTGVSITHTPGEGSNATIAIGQAVGTSSSVQFASVTAPLTGNASTATALETARNISLTGDVSGSVSFNGTSDVSISATVQPNSVALGTDTTGNYMSELTQGTGVTITHTPGEGSNATIAIGQAVGTSSSVTFAKVTISGNPSASTDAVTKSYVDNVAAGVNWHEAVSYATSAVLPNTPSYSNGTDGVGATLTTASNARLMVDGLNTSTGNRILVKNQSSQIQNGIYEVTAQGSVSTPWILTRAEDFNQDTVAGSIDTGEAVYVRLGNSNAGTGYVLTSTGTGTGDRHIPGTDSFVFTQFSGLTATVAGAGLSTDGAVLSIGTASSGRIVVNADDIDLATVAQSNSTDADGLFFAKTVNVDSYGRLTGVVSASVDLSSKANLASPTFTGTVTLPDNTVALGTKTTGDYVASLVAGTGVTLTNNSGENATPTIAIGQDVSASAVPTFGGVNLNGIIVFEGTTANEFETFLSITDPTADRTITLPDVSGTVITTGDTGSVTSTMIADGTIVNADINSSAAIDKTKISGTAITAGDTGTVTSTMIADGTIVDADINASAAIAHSKLANATAGQILLGTTTTGVVTATTISGDITINGAGVASIAANSVALGTDTTGNYMSDLTQGTGVTITHTPSEGSNATIAIGQAIGTSDSPTFAGVNVNGSIVFEGTTANEFETTLSVTDPTADRTITLPNVTGTVVTTGDTGSVTSTMITDGTIVNADINASAAIELSKLATSTAGNIIVYNASGVPTAVAETGDVTISDTGVTAIATGVIVNADVNASAAIAHSKLANATDGQLLLGTTTTGVVTATTVTGDVTITGAGVTAISSGAVVDADINTSAAIALSKLASGTSAQVVIANASGIPTYTTLTGDVTISNTGVTSIAADSVALGTDTTGNYVATITGGTGVTSTAATTGEGTTHTLSIGQEVGTSASVTFANLTLTGDLTVSGTTTSINTATLNVADNIVVLNNDVTGSPTENAGIEVERGTSANVLVRWNETSDKWEVTNDGTNYGNIVTTGDSGTVTSTMIADGTIVNADINSAAAIDKTKISGTAITAGDTGTVTSTMIADGTIVNADINTSAAIAHSKLANATAGQILLGTTTTGVVTATTVSGDVTITGAGVTAIGSGVIVDADIDASAAIALSKLATSTAGNIIVYNASGVPTAVAETGDITISDTGVTAIATGVIVNADVNASAAIDYSKLASLTSGNILVGNASNVATSVAMSGDVTITNAGVTAIGSGVIVDADINASAGIALSKLATSTAGNIIVYNASGVPTSVTETGDVTISDAGVTAIASGVIVNADVSASAAIDLGKIADVSTNAQAASYILVLADKNKIVEMGVGSANNLTVPLNSSVAFPIGSQINILQTGTGQTTIVATGGVTINATPGLKMRAQWSYATLVKRAENTWVLVGDISA
jgi:hypothetical protein